MVFFHDSEVGGYLFINLVIYGSCEAEVKVCRIESGLELSVPLLMNEWQRISQIM